MVPGLWYNDINVQRGKFTKPSQIIHKSFITFIYYEKNGTNKWLIKGNRHYVKKLNNFIIGYNCQRSQRVYGW